MEVSHEGTPKSSKLGIETHGDLGIPHFKRPLYVHAYYIYITVPQKPWCFVGIFYANLVSQRDPAIAGCVSLHEMVPLGGHCRSWLEVS